MAVLCCAGGATFFGLIASQSGPAGEAAESYVDAVIAGDDATALRYVCNAGGSQASNDDFKNHVQSKGVSGARVLDTSVSLWNLSWKATVRMEMTIGTGGQEPLTLPLAKEDGTWKVCS